MPSRQNNVEALLRVDVETARQSLDAAREALHCENLTANEARLLYRGAFSRYAVAMRRFSALVVDGLVPEDLQP